MHDYSNNCVHFTLNDSNEPLNQDNLSITWIVWHCVDYFTVHRLINLHLDWVKVWNGGHDTTAWLPVIRLQKTQMTNNQGLFHYQRFEKHWITHCYTQHQIGYSSISQPPGPIPLPGPEKMATGPKCLIVRNFLPTRQE